MVLGAFWCQAPRASQLRTCFCNNVGFKVEEAFVGNIEEKLINEYYQNLAHVDNEQRKGEMNF